MTLEVANWARGNLVRKPAVCIAFGMAEHMTKKVYERVLGTLSTIADEQCVTYEVQLGLEVADNCVSKVSLAPGSSVPDGDTYTLRYEYHGQRFEESGLRVQLATLLGK